MNTDQKITEQPKKQITLIEGPKTRKLIRLNHEQIFASGQKKTAPVNMVRKMQEGDADLFGGSDDPYRWSDNN